MTLRADSPLVEERRQHPRARQLQWEALEAEAAWLDAQDHERQAHARSLKAYEAMSAAETRHWRYIIDAEQNP